MKIIVVVLVLLSITAGCRNTNEALQKRITNADSVAINYFRGDGTMDTVVSVKIIRSKQHADELAKMIAGSAVTGKSTCGYDGSVHFFKMSKVIQDVDFRMNAAGCMQFSFLDAGELKYTSLTPAAKTLLESFKKQ